MTDHLDRSIPHELLGSWWISSAARKKYRGVLKLTPNSISLRIDGKRNTLVHFLNYSSAKNGPINGTLFDGRKVSLTNAFSGGGGFSHHEYQDIIVNLCIIGGHFKSDAAIKFDGIAVYLSYLGDWLQYSPFKGNPLPRKSKKIVNRVSCESIETLFDIEVPSLPGRVKTAHDLSFKGGGFTYVDWKHMPGIVIETQAQVNKEKLREFPYSLEQLFSLLIGYPVHPKKITCFNRSKPFQLFEIHFSFYERANNNPEDLPSYPVIVPLSKARRRLSKIFDLWFSQGDEERAIRNLFHSRFEEVDRSTLSHFLNYMQALEVYARLKHPQKRMNQSEFSEVREALVLAIPKSCSEIQRLELEGSINYLNNPSLRQRLEKLMSALPSDVNNALGFNEECIGRLVKTRNYFTHYSSGTSGKIFSSDELMMVIDKLECLLIIVQLKSLGFNPSQVVKQLSRTWKYNYALMGRQ